MSDKTLNDALNKLAKWRSVFAGWQLGTRAKGDPESDAIRDHRELTILLRAEVNAITKILQEKGILTQAEFQDILEDECKRLDKSYERKFPGYRAEDWGMAVDVEVARETMKGWRP